MYGFKDLGGAARAAAAALSTYMMVDALEALLRLAYPADGGEAGPADAAALLLFLVLILCIVLVGRWIYLASANAHALGGELSIRPGWAVGWYFVPVANLFMPLQAMKETWSESHDAAGLYEERESPLLGWWWGLWIATNILGNLSLMFGGSSPDALQAAVYVDLVAAALNIPLCLVLIRLINRLTHVQRLAAQTRAFA